MSSRVRPWTLALACTAAVATTTAERPGQVQSEDERAIHALEEQIEAATNKNDAEALSTLWAPDYMFVNPAGQRLTGADRLQLFKSGNLKLESYSRDQESIRVYGTTALVFFRSTVSGARGGTDISSQRRVTMVVVKRDGRWQAVSQQSSRILPSAPPTDVAPLRDPLHPDRSEATPQDAEQQIRRLEQAIADATGADNADALERLWAPEFLWVGPIGQVLTRADRLRAIRSGSITHGNTPISERYSIDEETVRVYGSTAVAIFRSTVAGAMDGKDISSRRRVTNVLVRSDGRWQAVSQHSTLIPQ